MGNTTKETWQKIGSVVIGNTAITTFEKERVIKRKGKTEHVKLRRVKVKTISKISDRGTPTCLKRTVEQPKLNMPGRKSSER